MDIRSVISSKAYELFVEYCKTVEAHSRNCERALELKDEIYILIDLLKAM